MAVILITGGARSGKSERAEKRARSFPGQPIYVATAEALDAEMEVRIAKHRASARPSTGSSARCHSISCKRWSRPMAPAQGWWIA